MSAASQLLVFDRMGVPRSMSPRWGRTGKEWMSGTDRNNGDAALSGQGAVAVFDARPIYLPETEAGKPGRRIRLIRRARCW